MYVYVYVSIYISINLSIYHLSRVNPIYPSMSVYVYISTHIQIYILDSRAGRGIPKMPCRLTYRNTQGNGAGNDRNPAHGQATPTQQTKLGTGGRELVDDEKSAANKTRVLRVEYRREDQYLSIEIQPYFKDFLFSADVGGTHSSTMGLDCSRLPTGTILVKTICIYIY